MKLSRFPFAGVTGDDPVRLLSRHIRTAQNQVCWRTCRGRRGSSLLARSLLPPKPRRSDTFGASVVSRCYVMPRPTLPECAPQPELAENVENALAFVPHK